MFSKFTESAYQPISKNSSTLALGPSQTNPSLSIQRKTSNHRVPSNYMFITCFKILPRAALPRTSHQMILGLGSSLSLSLRTALRLNKVATLFTQVQAGYFVEGPVWKSYAAASLLSQGSPWMWTPEEKYIVNPIKPVKPPTEQVWCLTRQLSDRLVQMPLGATYLPCLTQADFSMDGLTYI